jgi:hypothetical protein
MVGSGSRAIFSRTDTDNGAWLKEGILVSTALEEANLMSSQSKLMTMHSTLATAQFGNLRLSPFS